MLTDPIGCFQIYGVAPNPSASAGSDGVSKKQHQSDYETTILKITGTHIAYYFICHRKLWFFGNGIECEQESDAVRMGKHIHETSYSREDKEKAIDQTIVLDWIDHDEGIVHEVKKSDKMEESHKWQLRFYLWYLEQKGLKVADEASMEKFPDDPSKRGLIGELNYPKIKQKTHLVLKQADRRKLESEILPHVEKILNQTEPPPTVEWNVCKTCSYCELCHS